MTSAEQYARRVDAFSNQLAQWRGQQSPGRWARSLAERARDDPRRSLDANLSAVASYVEPDDVVVDVGGGAGRISLPLALRCREVINVDPSPAMRQQFEESARDAGILNARILQHAWPVDPIVTGDLVITTEVTYFVRDIVPFVQQLDAAARRRVIIGLWSVPPPAQGAEIYELVFGEPVVTPPGHRELLPVLWDLGVLPDIQVLPVPRRRTFAWPPQPTRELMVDFAVERVQSMGAVDDARLPALLTARFDDLFEDGPEGYGPRWPADVCEMLITWEPRH